MSQASEQIARQYAAAAINKFSWGNAIGVNVKANGAVGDGLADDTEAIQESIVQAKTTGTPILFPPGVYKANTLTDSDLVTMYGNNSTLLLNGVSYDLPFAELHRDGNSNLFLGKNAGAKNDLFAVYLSSAGQYSNTGIGQDALSQNSKGWSNVAVGNGTLQKNVYGYMNTAIGLEAMNQQVGIDEINSNARGSRNTAVGSNSLRFNNEGYGNTVLGRNAFHTNVSGHNNTAVGRDALSGNGPFIDGVVVNQTPKSCSDNVAVGVSALFWNNGDFNTALGAYAAQNIKSSTGNVVIGYQALTNMESDIAFGTAASNNNNVVIGTQAMQNATAGSDNVAVGPSALLKSQTSTNTAVGATSLFNLVSGSQNTGVGKNALKGAADITGSQNTGIGNNSLQNIVSGSQNTALGANALFNTQSGGAVQGFNNCTGVGYDSRISADNQVQLGNSATTTYVYGTVQNRSDERDKAEIRDTVLGLDFINALRPVDYKWNMREDYVEVTDDGETIVHENDGSKKRTRFHHGLIAQEVEQVIAETNVDFGGFQNHALSGGNDVLSVGYDELIAPLIKAVQELTQRVKELEAAQVRG